MVSQLSLPFLLLALCFLNVRGMATSTSPLKNDAVVLLEPVTEWKQVVDAARKVLDFEYVIGVKISPIPPQMARFCPSETTLRDSGVHHVLNLQNRDVYQCARQLQLKTEFAIRGIVPLSETAVEYSDLLAALLGVPKTAYNNDLSTVTCRRDKGLMKQAVERAGLRIAAFERINTVQQVDAAWKKLTNGSADDMKQVDQEKTCPSRQPPRVVVKTPQGFSTTDVYICRTLSEAQTATATILASYGPDGRKVHEVLVEEYIDGTEFAVNLLAFQNDHSTTTRVVTDIWKYVKTDQGVYQSAEICDPHDPSLAQIVEYAKSVAQAVGISSGAAHVELKAQIEEYPIEKGAKSSDVVTSMYVRPCLMEVGARLSGGRKASMLQEALQHSWNPFAALIQAHCGSPPLLPPSWSPQKFVKHLFLPITVGGIVKEVQIMDTQQLTTLHSMFMLVQPGDKVKRTTDLVSCAGFVWLVGESREAVERDEKSLLASFCLVMIDEES